MVKLRLKTYIVRNDETNGLFEVKARTIARVYKRYPGTKYTAWDKSRLGTSAPRQLSGGDI